MRRWPAVAAALCAAALPAAADAAPARIAHAFGDDLVLMNADGSGRQPLVSRTGRSAFHPAWSPDGDRIAFASTARRGGFQLLAVDPDGGDLRRLTTPPGEASDTMPAWSPDGARIAFVRVARAGEGARSQLVTMARDGSDEHVLYEETAPLEPRFFTAVTWSPDGSRLVYTRTVLAENGFRDTLFAVGSDGSEKPSLLARQAGAASFSPDGQRIAYVSSAETRGRLSAGEIHVMNADGSGDRRLTRSLSADDGYPAWSPDGRTIAFTSNRNYPGGGAGYEVYSIRPDGSCLTWLTNGSPPSRSSAWEPGGELSSEPGGCGATEREPVVDVDLRAARRASFPVWWLGEVSGDGLLLTGAERVGPGVWFAYEDCAFFDPRRCRELVVVASEPICRAPRRLDLRAGRLRLVAGMLIHRRRPDTEVYLGRTVVTLSGRGAGPVRDLRRFGPADRSLPGAAFPRRAWREFSPAVRRKLERLGARRIAC